VFRRPVKSALYIDFNNIAAQFVGGGFGDAFAGWLAWLEDGQFDPERRQRTFKAKRVYLSAQFRRHATLLEQAGFQVIPSAADLVIALDVAESLCGGKDIKEYVLLTVDSDFVHVLERLGERQKNRVVTVQPALPCAASFPPRAEITIPLENLRAAFDYRRHPGLVRRSSIALSRTFLGLGRIYRKAWPLSRPKRERPVLTAVADQVAQLAQRTPGLPVGRETVMRHLQRNMPEFRTSRFAGCGSYPEMIRQVAAIRDDLELFRHPNGGIAIMAPRDSEVT
jgi:NYN domain-containing protein